MADWRETAGLYKRAKNIGLYGRLTNVMPRVLDMIVDANLAGLRDDAPEQKSAGDSAPRP